MCAETWIYPNGAKQHETRYRLGEKRGQEIYWTATGAKQWEWNHHDDGTSDWMTWKNHELIPGTDKFFDHPIQPQSILTADRANLR